MMLRRLEKELRDFHSANGPVDGILTITPNEDDQLKWNITMLGLEGTPYETGRYDLTLHFPNDYPFKPPNIQFKTKMYHPSIHSSGVIQSCLLKSQLEQWHPARTVIDMLVPIRKAIMSTAGRYEMAIRPEVASDLETDLWKFISTVLQYNTLYANGDSLEIRELSNLQTYPFLTVEQCETAIPDMLRNYMSHELDVNVNVANSFSTIILEYCGNKPFGPFYNYEPWKKYCIDPNYYKHEKDRIRREIEETKQKAARRMEALKDEKNMDGEALFVVNVKTVTGQTYPIHCSETDTVLMLKCCIEVLKGMPYTAIDIVFGGKRLDENKVLSDYDIQADSTVYQMGKLRS